MPNIMGCPSFRSGTSVTNAGLDEKTLKGPPHGPSELYARAQDIIFDGKGSYRRQRAREIRNQL